MILLIREAISFRFVRALLVLVATLSGLHLLEGLFKFSENLSSSVGIDATILVLAVYALISGSPRPSQNRVISPATTPVPPWSPSVRKIELAKAQVAVDRILAQRGFRSGPPEYIWRQELGEIHAYLVHRLKEIGLQPGEGLEEKVMFIDRSAAATQDYSHSMAQGIMLLIEAEWKRQSLGL